MSTPPRSVSIYLGSRTELEEVLNHIDNEMKKTPKPTIALLKVFDAELDKVLNEFVDKWAVCERDVPSGDLNQGQKDYRALKRAAWNVKGTLTTEIQNGTPSNSGISIPVNKPLSYPRFPDVKIPTFNGDISQWNAFWDSYESIVDSRPDIDNVIKFNMLRSYLTEKAFKAIEGLPVSNDNYDVAVRLLKTKYSDDKKLLKKLHSDLIEIPFAQHNISALSNFHLTFSRILMQIEGVTKTKCESELYTHLITRKLSSNTLQQLHARYQTVHLDLAQLSEGIEYLISSMDSSPSLYEPSVKSKETTFIGNFVKPKPTVSKQATFSAYGPNTNKQSPQPYDNQSWNRTCVFCSAIHSSKFCSQYPSFESRRSRIRELGLCFKCMKTGHKSVECSYRTQCRNCSGSHHTFLCIKLLNNNTSINQVVVRENSPTVTPIQIAPHSSSSYSDISNANPPISPHINRNIVSSIQTDQSNGDRYLPPVAVSTAMVKISGSGVREDVRVFFDSGSQRTFMQASLAQRLHLRPISQISLKITAFGNKVQLISCDLVRTVIRIGAQRITISALVYDQVDTPIHIPGITKVIKCLKDKGVRLADPDIQSDVIRDIGLVIGADHHSKFVGNTTYCSGVILKSTPAGSVIFGPMPKWAFDSPCNTQIRNLVTQHAICARVGADVPETELDQIQNLWNLDAIGINNEKLTPEESQSVYQFESTCQAVGNKYYVELPFKNDERPGTNYRKAFGQLKSLGKTFRSNEGLYHQYTQIFKEYLDLGFIERVENPRVVDGQTHYLPHHPVFKKSATTPIRVVFNASSKTDQSFKSLNECLLTGPSLTYKLVDSLIEFRTNPLAVVADISKAFLRIGILPHCRDFCRFLFFEDESLEKVVTYRFKVVMFGVTSSPFLLQKTLNHHLENHPNPLAKTLIPHFYMDNFARTYSDSQRLRSEYKSIMSILDEASMPLQGWIANDDDFNQMINTDTDPLDVNVLGLHWDTTSDTISLYTSSKIGKAECMNHPPIFTKRKVVSMISSVFDPLGLLSPVLIKGKLFIQKLFKLNFSWDETLSDVYVEEFQQLCKSLSQVDHIQFPRFVIEPSQSDLHLFCDSSQVAYGIAVYVVKSGSSNLLLSKARVAPNPPLTIPKQELLALTLASRLADTLLCNKRLAFKNCTLWCDSEVALHWVHGNKSSEVFVRNRVAEIRTIRSRINFNIFHVPSQMNPADLLTRGVKVSKLNDSLWKCGPNFLLDPTEYPMQKDNYCTPVLVSEILVEPHITEPIEVFDMSKYSTLIKVIRVMQKVVRFCKIYLPDKFKLNTLLICVRLAQLQSFPTLYRYLQQPERCANVPLEVKNLVNQLDLHLNENQLICCGSRLQNSDLSIEAQFPIYLPAKHPLTKLIITHYHIIHHHCGLNTLLVCLRQRFWISKGRVTLKSVLKKCVMCMKLCGRSIPQPGPPPLPVERVKYLRPFHSIGVDYTGAIVYHNPSTTTDLGEKAYVCLMTCTVSRAVHLELCASLTTEDFLLAFRRFVSRFGIPSVVISDNGTCFKGAERFLSEIKDEPEVKNYMADHSISWKFNTPRAPWCGGFFERLIGIVKSGLQKCLYKKRVTFEELRTLLSEIECIVNSRPLTYLTDDSRDDYLTPSHLIYGRTVTLLPPLNSLEDAPYGQFLDLRYQYSRLSDILKKYENVWISSYLTSLRERHSTLAKDSLPPINVGDIILLELENRKRSNYPLGKVIELIKGKDGIVRSVVVFAGGMEYVRPISKVIPLELHQESVPSVISIEKENAPPIPPVPPRPKRQAAYKAEKLRGELLNEGLL